MSHVSSGSGSAAAVGEVSPPPVTPSSRKEEAEEPVTEPRRNVQLRNRGVAGNFDSILSPRPGLPLQGVNVPKPPATVSKVTQAVLMTPLHPVRLVHVLIQLGHEPVPPQRRYSLLFQRYMFYWPGVIGYAKAIANKDGWRELYRGVSGSLVVEIASIATSSLLSPVVKRAVSYIPLTVVNSNGDTPDNEDNVQTTRAALVRGVRIFAHQLLLRSSVTIIIQPFYTIAIRMIAQHVGKETIYNSVWSSFHEIYSREGLAGFYKGLVPALLGGVLSTVIHVTLWVGLELTANMVSQNWAKSLLRNIVRPFMVSYIPRSYSYPFELMRAVMAVNDSGLVVGRPPHIPTFSGWRDCFWHLKSERVLYRGSVFYLPRYASPDRS